ncbi:MAG TPA: thiamine pyrophosphate-binding protein [Allosphingosinicella sp.]|nr:thiamine pyrophosphate-binding protein [Allosphingosinicella sp.]
MTIVATNIEQAAPSLQEPVSRTAAKAIVDTLIKSNVEYVFGYSGGGTMQLISEISASGLPNLAARTEIGSAWMSYGYNRIKRRAASACLFHCVGALHVAPVIYAAKMDSTPFFMMDVNLSQSLDLREGLQEGLEVYPTLKQIAKYSRKVTTAEDVPLAVRQALLSSSSGRFGPSILDLGFQIFSQRTTCAVEGLELPELPAASDGALARAIEMIGKARKPVIIAGAGVHLSDASAELARFSELAQIPIVSTSWGGRGVIADDHPLFGGVMGAFGWVSANEVVQRADLWIALGTTFSQMTTGAWSVDRPRNVIHVDIDPNQLGKIFQPSIGIAADVKTVLGQFTTRMEKDGWKVGDDRESDWIAFMQEEKRKWFQYFDTLGATSDVPINQYHLVQRMNACLPKGSLVIGDSGGHAFMLYRAFNYQDVTQVATGSRYMSLGASLPVAIGAKLAAPDRVVVSYHGDGGFYYDFNDLSVLAQYGIKVIVIVDNNHCLLANRSGMRMMGWDNPWADLPESTDFVALGKALGVDGEKVTHPSEIDGAIKRALAAERSYLIEVVTDPDTRVRRAIKDVVPLLSDRPPSPGAEKHVGPPLEGSWPNFRS